MCRDISELGNFYLIVDSLVNILLV